MNASLLGHRPDLRGTHGRIELTVQKYPLPEFEIQKAPDAIAVVAMSGAVLIENTLDGFAPEQSPRSASRLR
jgi:hypothetical protein